MDGIEKTFRTSSITTGKFVEDLATQWLVRPGDLMYPDDGSKPTVGPYTVDHRIKAILNDCLKSSYTRRTAEVKNVSKKVSPVPDPTEISKQAESCECNRLRGLLGLYAHIGTGVEGFLSKMNEKPVHEVAIDWKKTSVDGKLHLWRLPEYGLVSMSKITEENQVCEIGCQQGNQIRWLLHTGDTTAKFRWIADQHSLERFCGKAICSTRVGCGQHSTLAASATA